MILSFGCMIVMVLSMCVIENSATGATIYLQDIDSGLTSPTGKFREMDVVDQLFSVLYRDSYNYTQAIVEMTSNDVGDTLHGTLNANNLKPNFGYQLKLAGFSGTPDNELIGLAGRWWRETWNGTAWANGINLNNKGNGESPNPNDGNYFSQRDETDPTSPTGLKYRFTGYLVFDYFITDEAGGAILNFNTDSSYHVLWKTAQRGRDTSDGPLKTSAFDADLSSAYYDTGGDDYPLQTVSIYGEWERLPVGGVFLQYGYYSASLYITEESFHGSGGAPYAGNWAAAMGADITFTLCQNLPVRNNGTPPEYHLTPQEAYDTEGGSTIIQSQSELFTENISMDLDKTLSLQGGYNCDYSMNTGFTIINGNIMISNGTVTLGNFILK